MKTANKYITFTNHQLYTAAYDYLVGDFLGISNQNKQNKLFNECERRNSKIWYDALEDALYMSETLRYNMDLLDKGLYENMAKVVKIQRLDHMESFELDAYLETVSAGYGQPVNDAVTKTQMLQAIGYQLKKNENFICEVSGHSMNNAGINDGAFLIVKRSETPKSGDIIIANVDGELLVKRLIKENRRIILHSENPDYPDIELNEFTQLMIWGVVQYIWQKPR